MPPMDHVWPAYPLAMDVPLVFTWPVTHYHATGGFLSLVIMTIGDLKLKLITCLNDKVKCFSHN